MWPTLDCHIGRWFAVNVMRTKQRKDLRTMYDSSRTEGGAPNATVRVLLTLTIIELAVATAYIHLNLGGLLFTLNGLGFLALAAAYGIAAAVRLPIVARFGWLPRVGLAAYAMVTIAAYLVIGPYFDLGWIAKGIEVAIVALVAADLADIYGSLSGVVHAATGSVRAQPQRRRRPAEVIQVD
jgi:hypothetical protein